jgi:Ca-activated chloride channel family protein
METEAISPGQNAVCSPLKAEFQKIQRRIAPMNAKRILYMFFAALFVLSACQTVARTIVVRETQIVTMKETEIVSQQVNPHVYPTAPAMPTMAYTNPQAYPPTPAPTQALPGYYPTTYVPQPYIPVSISPDGNYFQNYGYNFYEVTAKDHLSTFGLDVDTASYTVARKYLDEGNLPPADAIRVEEFINYFKGGYPAPLEDTFAIYTDGAPSPFSRDGTYILRVGIQGREVPEFARKPFTLTLVVDCSGSMDMENRIQLLKDSLLLLVDRLGEQDVVTIVAYSTNAWTVLEPTSGIDRYRISNAIYSLYPQETTNAEAGLRLGYQWAMATYRPDTVNRVILLSDGVANEGVTDAEGILNFIKGYVSEGVTLTTIGVGMGNFNDVLLEQLADKGDGFYAYVDDLDEARRLFVEELTSTMQIIARDAKAQVDFNPEVVAWYRQIGYENRQIADQDFRNDAVDAGEIGAGHSVTVLYEVGLRPHAEGRIATVFLRWQDADTYEVREINAGLNGWDLYPDFRQSPLRYQLHVLVAEYAEILRQSPYAYGFSLQDICAYLPNLYEIAYADGDVNEWITLVNRTVSLAGGWGW